MTTYFKGKENYLDLVTAELKKIDRDINKTWKVKNPEVKKKTISSIRDSLKGLKEEMLELKKEFLEANQIFLKGVLS